MLISEIVLSPEQLRAVGCLALESTRLETHIEQAIIDHCGDIIGQLLIDRRMLDAKVEIFRSIFTPEALNDEHAKELEQLYGEIKSDIPRRNTVIHGSWKEVGSIADLYARSLDTSTERDAAAYRKAMKVSASEVMDLARRFGRYQIRLVDWYMQVRERYDALHGTRD